MADPGGGDKGVLVLVKPVLTGDEPADVRHYRDTHPDFPQQPTSDQFYDEAQWESYRRLGEHAIRDGLRCTEGLPATAEADAVFGRIRQRWYPAPPDFERGQMEATRRHAAFETRFWREAPLRLQQEFFRETATDPTPPAPSSAEAVGWLLDIQRHMEELYSLCRLGAYWNHPRNSGWMNLLLRWTHSPTFRAWWPILRPLRDPAFREFAETQLSTELPLGSRPQEVLPIDLPAERKRAELILERDFRHLGGAGILSGKDLLFVSRMALATAPPKTVMLLALPVRRSAAAPQRAEWRAADFLALPGLWGSGFGGDFIRQVQGQLADRGFRECLVTIDDAKEKRRSDAGSRRETADQLGFYGSKGYILLDRKGSSAMLQRHLRQAADENAPPGTRRGVR